MSPSNRPFRVAIIGSGPSGFFAAEELLGHADVKVEVDIFDALPTPFGLVRGGVAPDHPKIKNVTAVYERTALRPGFRFFGNVEFGRDVLLDDLERFYDAIIFAHGARSDRRMGIPGEDLAGSHAATEFVGWYNGHPDYQDRKFDLSVERAAVVGNGNVAMDVARILAQPPERLAPTDVTEQALAALRSSRIKEIYLLGRRGPAQAAFTTPEIRELCELPGCDAVVEPKEVELDAESQKDLANLDPKFATARNNVEVMIRQSQKGGGSNPKKIFIRFLQSPVEIIGENGKVKGLKIEKNKLIRDPDGSLRAKGTGKFETLPVGMVLRSVGYKGLPLRDIPYDDKKGTVPNEQGRVLDSFKRAVIPGLYVVGWAKRGPSGVIGTNKPDSIETVRLLLEDLKKTSANGKKPAAELNAFLESKGIRYVTFQDWKQIDNAEVERGKAKGKSREKFTRIADMLNAIQ